MRSPPWWVVLVLGAAAATVSPRSTGPSRALAAAASRVPKVVVDAAAIEGAARVAAPIAEVTVYSDRARVRRRGRAPLPGGAALVRLPDLPGAVFLDTVRLSANGARVLRVEAKPIERERLAIDQAKKLLDELDAVEDRLAELEDRAARAEWTASLVTRLVPAAPVPEEKREGRKGLPIDVASWLKALDFVGENAGATRAQLAALVDERRTLAERRDRVRADIAVLNQGGFSSRLVEVTAVLEGGAGNVDLELEYFVPGAQWKPAYDLHFTSAKGQIRMETAAAVAQTTGEDWEKAALFLSTAMPGRGIDLPELLTWTLGERGDFVPRPRPRPTPRPVAPMASAPPRPPSPGENVAIEAAMVRDRLFRVVEAVSAPTEPARWSEGQLGKRAPSMAPGRPPSPRMGRVAAAPSAAFEGAPAPAAAPAMEMAADEEDRERDMVAVSAPAPHMIMQRSQAKEKSASSAASVPLALFDRTVARRPPTLHDPYLPAVSGGGLDYVYQAATPATVPSTGHEIRIPLTSQSFRTAVFYEATPALATTAFLRARVRNDGKRPLLRGPVTIFGDGELVGVGEIQTTGPGGDIELPLGADQDIRLVRQIVPSTKTTGLILKSEETTYDVQIQVGNYKKQAAAIEILDQVPSSRQDKVEVKLLGADPAPRSAPDADGVVRWRVDLPAGGTRTLKLRYVIKRPKGWTLFQR